jgi:hypothetical protein
MSSVFKGMSEENLKAIAVLNSILIELSTKQGEGADVEWQRITKDLAQKLIDAGASNLLNIEIYEVEYELKLATGVIKERDVRAGTSFPK